MNKPEEDDEKHGKDYWQQPAESINFPEDKKPEEKKEEGK